MGLQGLSAESLDHHREVGHATHSPVAGKGYWPEGHPEQPKAPMDEYVPGGQGTHAAPLNADG